MLTKKELMAVSFTAGVVGAAAVLLFSVVLYYVGISPLLGIDSAPKFAVPDVYRPLFWGGLWGIPFGLVMAYVHKRLYFWGFLYFLAPVAALYLIFEPMHGLGFFGLAKGLPFAFYLLLVNAPFGIVTAVIACWLTGYFTARTVFNKQNS